MSFNHWCNIQSFSPPPKARATIAAKLSIDRHLLSHQPSKPGGLTHDDDDDDDDDDGGGGGDDDDDDSKTVLLN